MMDGALWNDIGRVVIHVASVGLVAFAVSSWLIGRRMAEIEAATAAHDSRIRGIIEDLGGKLGETVGDMFDELKEAHGDLEEQCREAWSDVASEAREALIGVRSIAEHKLPLVMMKLKIKAEGGTLQ